MTPQIKTLNTVPNGMMIEKNGIFYAKHNNRKIIFCEKPSRKSTMGQIFKQLKKIN